MGRTIRLLTITVFMVIIGFIFNSCPDDTEELSVLNSIAAAYTQTTAVYSDTPLNELKAGLTVTAYYSDGSNEVINAADYTLSGTLTVPSSEITVVYEEKTAAFTVNVTAIFEHVTGTPGLEFTLISNGTAYSVARGTATATEVVIPAIYRGLQVTRIGSSAFRDCSSLTSVVIPDSVTSIGSSAFRDCSSLTKITLPAVSRTFTSMFGDASNVPASLKTVVINGGTAIPDSSFEGCTRLTSIVIPDSVTSIGNSMFENCSSLTTVFYGGADIIAWNNISIGFLNTPLTSATRYYYSATNPGTLNTHWRFVNGVPAVW